MGTLKVATLVEALKFVGLHYRKKDGKPADAVSKLLSLLAGSEHLSLNEWAEDQGKTKAKPKSSPASIDEIQLQELRSALEGADTQEALRKAIKGREKRLSADNWKAASLILVGKSPSSGKAARDLIETHFSNALLLRERVRSVDRIYGNR